MSVMALLPVRADEVEDNYFMIWGLIQQANDLAARHHTQNALAKYQQAQADLQNFRQVYPDWQPKMINYRWDYVAAKIAALAAQNASAPAATSVSATNQPAATPPADSAVEEPDVKLIDPGSEPRKVLRLHPTPGQEQSVAMRMKTAMEMKLGEKAAPDIDLPPMVFNMDITVKSVSPSGDIAYDCIITNASVGEDAEASPAAVSAMKSSLEKLNGLSASGVSSSRGLPESFSMRIPSGADAQTRQALGQMKETMAHISAPLPEEAVGPGAKWEVKMPVKTQGMTIDQTATFQITALEGERMVVKVTVLQTAANQTLQSPAAPGMKLNLIKMNGHGSGEATYDFTQLAPPACNLHMQSDVSMAMNQGGQKQPMSMKVNVDVTMESK